MKDTMTCRRPRSLLAAIRAAITMPWRSSERKPGERLPGWQATGTSRPLSGRQTCCLTATCGAGEQ